jgi:hypothetical protein
MTRKRIWANFEKPREIRVIDERASSRRSLRAASASRSWRGPSGVAPPPFIMASDTSRGYKQSARRTPVPHRTGAPADGF